MQGAQEKGLIGRALSATGSRKAPKAEVSFICAVGRGVGCLGRGGADCGTSRRYERRMEASGSPPRLPSEVAVEPVGGCSHHEDDEADKRRPRRVDVIHFLCG